LCASPWGNLFSIDDPKLTRSARIKFNARFVMALGVHPAAVPIALSNNGQRATFGGQSRHDIK